VSRSWIAVACAAHVRRGLDGGFMQVCHGKAGPLRRLKPGDRVAYYSPTLTMEAREPCQMFTAIGTVADDHIEQVTMSRDFHPFRRAVRWQVGTPTPIRPMLDRLALTRGRRQWGAAFRYGLVAVPDADMDAIAAAMGSP
jgi:hypothetical protein